MQTEHFITLELALAEVGLIDEEVDVSRVFLVDDALELVIGCSRGECSCIGECGGGYDTVGHFDAGQYVLLAFLVDGEVEVELRLLHRGLVEIIYGDGYGSTVVIRHYGIVAANLFALECHG